MPLMCNLHLYIYIHTYASTLTHARVDNKTSVKSLLKHYRKKRMYNIIDINSKKYKDYVKQAKELYVAQIYKSYDKYINQSYKIDIKANVLKRIENSF